MSEFSEKPLLGIPSGKLMKEALLYLQAQGVPIQFDDPMLPRKMVIPLAEQPFDLFVAKPKKIPELVGEGAVDFAYSCSDALIESSYQDDVVKVRDLDQGVCDLELMCADETGPEKYSVEALSNSKIGTSYPKMTSSWIENIGVSAQIRPWPGGVEGLIFARGDYRADFVTDLVETGETRDANRLRSLAKLATVNAVLIESKNPSGYSAFRDLVNRELPVRTETVVRGPLADLSMRLDQSLANEYSYSYQFGQDPIALRQKLGEEIAEFIAELSTDTASRRSLIDEAQQAVYMLALATKARRLELYELNEGLDSLEGLAGFRAVEYKSDATLNNSVKSIGAAAMLLGGAMVRPSTRDFIDSSVDLLRGLREGLAIYGIRMDEVYEVA